MTEAISMRSGVEHITIFVNELVLQVLLGRLTFASESKMFDKIIKYLILYKLLIFTTFVHSKCLQQHIAVNDEMNPMMIEPDMSLASLNDDCVVYWQKPNDC